MHPLRLSSLNSEPPMQASKWLKVQALLDEEEMAQLFGAMGNFVIYLTGSVLHVHESVVSKDKFLQIYKDYVTKLKEGQVPEPEAYVPFFSSVLTSSSNLLYAIPFSEGRQLVRVSRPVIQMQAHSMDYTAYDGKFRPMSYGVESIAWGIQFSYPQLFLNESTKEIMQVKESDDFPNTKMFHHLQKWIRYHTLPTPFIVENKKINAPVRIGKQCLSWINRHPHLILKNIKVVTS
jgi:hypothetical protein